MKRLISIIFIAFTLLSELYPDEINTHIEKSVVLLLDLSYSMRLKDEGSGKQRLALAKSAIVKLLKDQKPGQEWSLITFSDRDSILIRNRFTDKLRNILSKIGSLKTLGISPIGEALNTASDYLAEEGKGAEKMIVLVSDCIPSEGRFPTLRTVKNLMDKKIILCILGFELPENRTWFQEAQRLTRMTGGEAYPITQVEDFLKDFKAFSITVEEPISRQLSAEKGLKPFWAFVVGALLTLGFFLVFLSAGKKLYELLKEQREYKRNPKTVTYLDIRIKYSSGEEKVVRFQDSPVTLVRAGRRDLIFSQPEKDLFGLRSEFAFRSASDFDFRSASEFALKQINGSVYFLGAEPQFINGVLRREKRLKIGDRIAFGSYRIFFEGFKSKILSPPKRQGIPLKIEGAVLILLILLAWNIPRISTVLSGGRNHSRGEVRSGIDLSNLPKQGSIKIKTKKVKAIAPNEEPDYFKADILCIHAHPDDESLDFGGLIAKASRAGKKIVTVLFTDGESGIDQFPGRAVSDQYPADDLTGSRLAQVRIQEAERALSILGADTYVRLGLPNHPYNSLNDTLSLHQVLNNWGGEHRIVQRLIELIKGYRPGVVISPDTYSQAFEHFEHEVVGYLTRKALQTLKQKHLSIVKGYLVSVDPLQKDFYSDLLYVDVMVKDPESGVPYRLIQQQALKQYRTQRDASVIGVEVKANFAQEYYHAVFWESPEGSSGDIDLDAFLRK